MTTTQTPAAVLLDLDPRELLIDLNVRLDARVDEDFIASVRGPGRILVPLVAVRTSEGQVRVRMGHRRTLAAIEAGLPTVPVVIVGDEDITPAGELSRISDQFTENHHRAGLTATEEALVVTGMLDLGLSAEQVLAATRLPEHAIEAAKRVTRSKTATKAGAGYALDLEQTAAIAEFDKDKATVKKLLAAAEQGPGQFAHTLQRARDDRADAALLAEARAALEADGVKVADQNMSYENRLEYWAGPDKKAFTAETHKDCPGHRAQLRVSAPWTSSGDRKATVDTGWYCEDPRGNGHKKHRTPSSAGASQDPEQRREVIENNKRWRSAEKVRRAWLRDKLLTRKTPPAAALRFVLSELARGDYALRRALESGHRSTRPLLGFEPFDGPSYGAADTSEFLNAIASATDGRATVIALGLILGAIEETTGVHTWRGGYGLGTAQRYFGALQSWGYDLSPVERLVLDARDPYANPAVADDEPDPDDEMEG